MVVADDLNTAIPVYLGYKASACPIADFKAVIDRLGLERALAIEIPLLVLLGDLERIEVDWRRHSLFAGSEWAVRELGKAHAGLDAVAVKALVWAYSYGHK